MEKCDNESEGEVMHVRLYPVLCVCQANMKLNTAAVMREINK